MGQTLNPGQALLSLRQAGAMMNSMNLRQRLIVAGGVVAVVIAMAVMLLRMNQPTYTPLFTGLQTADVQQIASHLDTLAIPYQLSPDGTGISVPGNQLDRARLALAAQGLPHSGQTGFEIFDKTNWSGSDFAEQVNYQRALEGELERTIESMDDVRSAKVQITMAHDSLFTSEQRPAKAAVLLNLKDGVLSPGLVSAVRQVVAGSVDHLAPGSVSVMDAGGQVALNGTVAAQNQMETELEEKIIATLAPIVGAQHVRASVTVNYDPTSSDDTQETYNPNASAVVSSQTSRIGPETAVPASGVPGTTSNLPKAQAPGTSFKAQLGLAGTPGQQTESQTYAVSRNVDHTVRPADTVQRITAAVVVDNATAVVTRNGHIQDISQPRPAAEMQQLQALVAAAIGLNPQRGDVLTVTNMPFLAPSAAPFARRAPAAPAGWSEKMPLPLSWIAGGVAVLLLVGLLLGVVLRRRTPAPAPAATARKGITAGESLATTEVEAVPADEVQHEVLNMTELLEADPEATPPEVRQVLQLKGRLAERVKREPAIAARLVQGWMSKHREEAG